MSNVTLAIASASVRPFVWGDPGIGVNYTTLPIQSNGKYKETLYTSFQAVLTDTVAGPTATVVIQGTNDALTGAGVLLPVQLNNSSTAVTIPTQAIGGEYYTVNVLDSNFQPTGQRSNIPALPYQSFFAVPTVDAWQVYPPGNVLRGIPDGGNPNSVFSLTAGMSVYGLPGLGATNTIASLTSNTITLSAAFTGATGIYYVYFANNYWNATPLGTITLNAGTATYASDGFTSNASAFRFVRANVTVLTGSAPQLMVFMGA